jgi:hypothetical protein
MSTLTAELQRLARLSGATATAAANAWAGTTGLPLVAALNVKAGTAGLALQGAVNRLAGTQGRGETGALALLIAPPKMAKPTAVANIGATATVTFTALQTTVLTSYTFTVRATNIVGTSPASDPSNAVTALV